MEKKTCSIEILGLTRKAVVLVCARIPPGFQNHRFRGYVVRIWTICKGCLGEVLVGGRCEQSGDLTATLAADRPVLQVRLLNTEK